MSESETEPCTDTEPDSATETDTHSLQADDTSSSETDLSTADRPQGPRGLPLIGSTLSIARDPFSFVESAREYGDIASYRAYGTEFALVFDPHVVETVLVSRSDEFRKGEFETAFGELVAPEGIAFTEDSQWRRQRKLLQSSFTPDHVRAAADEIVAEANAFVDDWDDGERVALRDTMSTYTLRILTRTLFDLPLEDDRATIVRRAANAVNTYASPKRLALGSILPSWLPDRVEREYEDAMADLETLTTELVETRRSADSTGEDLLSILARAVYPDGSRLSPETVRDQLVTFLFAGHETTATTLAIACWLLADNPQVHTELERELAAVCGDRKPDAGDLASLDYTEAVLREAMRLYPPVTGIYREPLTDTALAGFRISSGTTLQLSVYGIHRDDRWWEDPEAFCPERWLVDADRPEYAYFPFGGGPRHCLGMRFAMVELQLALASIMRRVEFECVTPTLEPSLGVTLDPGSVETRVRKR
ncbi:cytochrome P450 [Natrialba aegyptia]|uniref:Cytochrome P450 n=1 Tax=Natrialba aegyptia DSM 13077 TaxID=1227491 RepID=M0B8S3_9EURY|nr:cytochrome P450 [Natrialba aegyptia]ELZ06693.1 cytochrome P450 [Natrialba aegyptia DSM 13077]